jgi:hypothetical protein
VVVSVYSVLADVAAPPVAAAGTPPRGNPVVCVVGVLPRLKPPGVAAGVVPRLTPPTEHIICIQVHCKIDKENNSEL